EARRTLEVAVHNDSTLVRTYTLPPGTPKDRVQILRKAFQETLRDPAFLADSEKQKLEIEPVTAEEIERAVESLFKLEPAMVTKLRTIPLEGGRPPGNDGDRCRQAARRSRRRFRPARALPPRANDAGPGPDVRPPAPAQHPTAQLRAEAARGDQLPDLGSPGADHPRLRRRRHRRSRSR